MASDAEYATKGLPPAPAVSMRTMAMAGLLVDVYGLDEVPGGAPVTCLWLLHPRTRTRMHDIARRVVGAWNQGGGGQQQQQRQQRQQHGEAEEHARGLVALAFDMPNHGSRLVSAAANEAWDRGNERNAVDMAGIVGGARRDLGGLMDLAGAYLSRRVDGHVALGWSLGGHAAWQALVGEARLDAAVVVVGCPDLLGLMAARARQAGLDTGGGPLVGSRFLPRGVAAACAAHDPGALPAPPLLDARLRGKKALVCSGGADATVPYARAAPLLALLKDAVRPGGWYADGGVELDDRVYEGVGHVFSAAMVTDAVAFLVRAMAEGRGAC